MYDSRYMVKENNIVFTLTPFTTESTQLYTFSFDTGGYYTTNSYYVWYSTTTPLEDSRTYRLRYESHYDDSVQGYKIRFTSGSDTSEKTTRYLLRYTLSGLDEYTNYYSIKFTSDSPTENTYRQIYKVRYTSNGASDKISKYKLRFTEQPYREQIQSYKLSYSSEPSDEHFVQSVLLGSEKGYDLICMIESLSPLDTTQVTLTNVPRYIEVGTETVGVTSLDEGDIYSLGLFNSNLTDSYKTYLKVTSVNPAESCYVDIDDQKVTLHHGRSTQSPTDIVVDGVKYDSISYKFNYTSYSKLKFVTTTLTPKLSLDASCCFSMKIKGGSIGTACSPF